MKGLKRRSPLAGRFLPTNQAQAKRAHWRTRHQRHERDCQRQYRHCAPKLLPRSLGAYSPTKGAGIKKKNRNVSRETRTEDGEVSSIFFSLSARCRQKRGKANLISAATHQKPKRTEKQRGREKKSKEEKGRRVRSEETRSDERKKECLKLVRPCHLLFVSAICKFASLVFLSLSLSSLFLSLSPSSLSLLSTV